MSWADVRKVLAGPSRLPECTVTRDGVIKIIEKHLELDTVHIEYHRESTDMVGHMADEIMRLHDQHVEGVVYQIEAGEEI